MANEQKPLGGEGVLYLWQKIKEAFVSKEDGKGLSTNDYTTAEKTKLSGIEAGANKTTVDSVLSSSSTNPIQNKVVQAELNKKAANTDMKGATTDSNGAHGLVPAPTSAAKTQFLRGDGTWATPVNTTYTTATTAKDGLLSKADKAKLDAFGSADTYAKKSDLTSLYRYKGSVATYDKLPTGATTGDTYNVEDTGMNYAWTGTNWDALGMVLEIDYLTNSEIDTIIGG